jgi:3D-(3,5/4)-trihydroxycyclohexane-1,2-dione acylhydrolase (decyclizing)
VRTGEELKTALASARQQPRTSVVVIETSYDQRVPGYESWWDVPIAEVSERDSVKAARKKYDDARKKERYFF